MKTSDLEKRMKQLLEEQEYTPPDAAWEKMQQALHPPAASRNVLFLLPVWKAAAAVALLLTTGLGTYYMLKEDKIRPAALNGNGNTLATTPTTPDARNNQVIPDTQNKTATATEQKTTRQSNVAYHAVVGHQQTTGNDTLVKAVPVVATQVQPAQEPADKATANNNHLARQDKPAPGNGNKNVNYLFQDAPPRPDRKSLNLGIAANIGKPSTGDVQYNVGIVARKDINARIFAEANVSLAATQVRYSEVLPAQPGFEGLGSSDFGSSSTAEDVQLNYTNNIISIGFAPVIGVKATDNIALSVGGDVYKSLNRNLNRKSGQTSGLMDATRLPTRSINDWDAGIKAQLDYKLSKRFSVNTQYRHGLTSYITIDGKSIKNSVFNVGLKYYIGK